MRNTFGICVAVMAITAAIGAPAGSQPIAAQANNDGQTTVRLGRETVTLDALPDKLKQLIGKQSGKTLAIHADGQLPFGEVVHVIDACQAAGARTFLQTSN